MSQETAPASPFRGEVKALFQAAMVVFLVTIFIGVLNGLDLIEFARPTLLTHVHAGTLGWITLCVLGAALWLFSPGASAEGRHALYIRGLTWVAIVATAFYVLTFLLNNATARPVAGSLVLGAILGFLAWVVVRSRQITLTVPHLAILAALTTLAIGAVLGVLLQVYLAGSARFLPQGAFGSHPATMVTGYLILAGMAVTEWRLTGGGARAPISRLGVAQVALPFLGGLALLVGTLADIFALIALIVPCQVLGVLIYLGRLRPQLARIHWFAGGNERLFGLSAVFLAVNVGMIAYLIASYANRFDEVPAWLFFALDHAVFIGVMTNGLLGLVYEVSRARRSFWPWVDHVLFWGMNIGMVGFVSGLIVQEAALKRAFTPVMGTSILLALLTYTLRLQTKTKQAG
ncbi:MAG: hypothetical protein HY684_02130 [Chloroflexi bacterium]|nr:hypothetical protein [Chloroflexota bacterium]